MIIKLLRADLRSDRVLILIAMIASIVLWISETTLRNEPTPASLATWIYSLLPFPILIAVTDVRKLLQKRERLLARLPVTSTAIRIASWLSFFSVIAAACLISAALMTIYPITRVGSAISMDPGIVAAFAALMIALFTSAIAMLRIVYSSRSIRRPESLLVIAGCLIVFVLISAQWGLFVEGRGPFRVDADIQWSLLISTALGLAFALVVADIMLDRLAADRLR